MASSWRVAAFTLVAATAAPALGQLTKDEQACQQEASKQTATFLAKTIRCLVACDKRALKGKAPGTDCLPPFGGQALECVETAEAKALGGVVKKCALDCPECYDGGDCGAHAAALIGGVETQVDAVIPIVRCDDSASPDGLTKDEAKVRQKVAVVVGSFLSSSEKCLAKCRKQEAAGKVGAGACTSGAETDQKTIDCLVKAALKALDFVEDPELDAPECLAPELPFALTRAAVLLDDFDPLLFCGSPSAAFVEQAG